MAAISCLPEDLLSDARLIDCCIPRGAQLAVLISLLCQLNDMSCDAPTLLAEASCIDSCIPDGSKMAVLISLMCQFVEGGGGGGGVQQIFPDHYGGSVPTFTPPKPYAIAPDLDSPYQTFIWNPDTSAWT